MINSKDVNQEIVESHNDEDLEKQHNDSKSLGIRTTLTLAFGTLGVIFGDIGTSPLYTYNSIITDPPQDERDVLGVASLIIWSLTIIPMIKYVFLVLRADDNGMGGTFALYSTICRHSGLSVRGKQTPDDLNIVNYDTRSVHSAKESPNILARSKRLQKILLIVVLLAASLIMSDGLLTPAISVISAVEGMAVPAPSLNSAVLPLSIVILICLFMVQSYGTNKVGVLFSPIVTLWFLSLAIIGIWNISQYPAILKAFNPQYAIEYFVRNGRAGYISLGGVLLAVTGVEALYADLGHFSRAAIQISFPCFVYPPLVLAYLGQGARLALDPSLINGSLFWLTTPSNPGIYWIVFVLATLATIIASQAMISATFSLIHQAMQLDCFPRVKVIHTSKKIRGQIYIPEINYMLMVAIVLVCLGFQHSAKLTTAYGVAVITVVFITTILYSIAIHVVWGLSIFLSIAFLLIFGLIEISFMGATFVKIVDGGWFTVSFGILLASLMLLWKWGTNLKLKYELNNKTTLDGIFLMEDVDCGEVKEEEKEEGEGGSVQNDGNDRTGNSLKKRKNQDLLRLKSDKYPIARLPGTGLFYNDVSTRVPLTFNHFINHFPALQKILIFITIRPLAIPFVSENDRLVVQKIGKFKGFYRVIARYGYMDAINQDKEFIRKIVDIIRKDDVDYNNDSEEVEVKRDVTTYFVPRQTFEPKSGSNWFRKALLECYTFLVNNSRQSYRNWHIPIEDVIDVGMKIAV